MGKGGTIIGELVSGQGLARWTHSFPNGDTAIEGTVLDGERSGDWKFWHPNGKLRASGSYERGAPGGAWEFWTLDGDRDPELSGSYQLVSGEGAQAGLSFSGWTLDGEAHGPWTIAWEDGSPMLQARLHRGRPVGRWRFFHHGRAFDPEFVSADHGEVTEPEGFFELPTSPQAEPQKEPTVFDPSGLPADLAEVPALSAAPGIAAEQQAQIERHLKDYLNPTPSEDRRSDAQELIRRGGSSLPALLNELRLISWREPTGIERARRLVEGVLQPIFGGRSFGWRWSIDDGAWNANRLSFLRAYGFYLITGPHSIVWHLDCRLPTQPVAPGQVTSDLLRPWVSLSEMSAGRIPGLPPYYDVQRAQSRSRSAAGGALDEALEWLSRHQSPNGSWSSAGFMRVRAAQECGCDGPGSKYMDVGVTGLALLAFLGSGNSLRDGPYRRELVSGIRWLLENQDQRTGLIRADAGGYRTDQADMYGHGIATLALCEATASARSRALLEGGQRAVDYILTARNPYGAWRYDMPPMGDSDTSVTGWMVEALQSAERAGLDIDPAAYVGALNWIAAMTDDSTGRVGYDSQGSRSSRAAGENEHFPPEKGEAMTAIGLACSLALGQDPATDAVLMKQAELLLKVLPEWAPRQFGCDMYYWYHGSRAMRYVGGRHWRRWNGSLKRTLLDSQRKDQHFKGSWDPVGPWGHAGGRVYSTALMALCLETY
ncbi:MAG: hypothetical protein GY711_05395 [bacterium]|nr:hypothetical protein [bacterium]